MNGSSSYCVGVSVAMATFNGGRFLIDQLHSLRRQTLLPAELIASDDGSDDDTIDILRRFAEQAPFPVVILQGGARRGYRANFLHAVAHCRHDLIAFCDQDDVWHEDKLAAIVPLFEAPDVLLAFHDALLHEDHSTHRRILRRLGRSAVFAPLALGPWTVVPGLCQVFRRDLTRWTGLHPGSVDPFDAARPMAHDQFFLFWASVLGQVAFVDRPLAKYRQHDANAIGWPLDTWRARAKRDTAHADLFSRGEALAAHDRIGLLRSALPQLDGDRRERATAGIAYYEALLPHLTRRADLYAARRICERAGSFAALLRGGAYGGRKPVGLDIGAMIMDLCLGVPFGPRLKHLRAGEETGAADGPTPRNSGECR